MAGIVTEGMKVDLKEILGEREISEGKEPKTYASQILEIKNEKRMLLAMPMIQGRLIPLAKGERFDAYYYTNKGLYTAQINILERYKSGNIYSLDVAVITELKKFQRRQFFRLEKSIPVMYTEVTERERDDILEENKSLEDVIMNSLYSEGVSLDVSGGGMRLVGTLAVDKDKPLIVSFATPTAKGMKSFKLLARTIQSEKVNGRKDRIEHRIEFLNISPEDREELVRYIFDEQLKGRRNTK